MIKCQQKINADKSNVKKGQETKGREMRHMGDKSGVRFKLKKPGSSSPSHLEGGY